MPAHFATDSRGRSHYILHQELAMSCGPASVAMVEEAYKRTCIVDSEGRARQLSQNYPGKFTPEAGTTAGNLAYVLNAEGVPTYASECVAQARLFDYFWAYVGPRTPIIAKILWSGGARHFTVLKQIDPDHRMIFLDPWYDVVEVPRAQLPNYRTSDGTAAGQLEGWLTIPHL